MKFRAFKYFSPLLIYIGAIHSFTSYGIICFLPLIYAWVIIPVTEYFLRPDTANLSDAEEELAKADRTYDYILYGIVFLQFPTLFLFLSSLQDPALRTVDLAGRIGTMGLLCGTLGINVGHELGHRSKQFEIILGKLSLLSSLYMHFYIEHNKGHHRHVGTPADPSSARFGESVYHFWMRSIVFSYISAWNITNTELRKEGRKWFSLKNEMIHVQLIQICLCGLIYFYFGPIALLCFFGAAFIGILLLETVNYIEHYGLSRRKTGMDKYERAMPHHSWNSNHVIGRLMLFELSRHSDHHYLASRKYQLLRHHEDAPQMPTGYPGMMMLSLVPPLWFSIMNKKVKKLTTVHTEPQISSVPAVSG
ncbi:MAG TPA: alkane 1-monooxygenase [Flavitalea sp.]|nr:alkane 1-monooxygenase [Flavitalea sp.]